MSSGLLRYEIELRRGASQAAKETAAIPNPKYFKKSRRCVGSKPSSKPGNSLLEFLTNSVSFFNSSNPFQYRLLVFSMRIVIFS